MGSSAVGSLATNKAGLGSPNNSGVVVTQGFGAKSWTVQFNEPLRFARALRVTVSSGPEPASTT